MKFSSITALLIVCLALFFFVIIIYTLFGSVGISVDGLTTMDTKPIKKACSCGKH